MSNKFNEEIQGEYIVLKKVTPDDAEIMYKWRSGPSGKFLRVSSDFSVENQLKWINSRPDSEINYVVYDKKTGEKVGTVSIYDVNHYDKLANVGRLLLADEYLTKSSPYGLEALKIAYGEVFNFLKFRKITGDIFYENANMIKLQKFLGMKEEGVLKQHSFINGHYGNLHILSLFAEEYPKYAAKIDMLLKGFK
jgi:RimJ/RimL family protein N-acetyltransferase